MIILGLSILFLMLAGVCSGMMDRWMVKYALLTEKLEGELNSNWWSYNPLAKWENGKYNTRRAYNILLLKIGIKTRLLSDNCNDAWHFFKSLMVVFICLAIVSMGWNYYTKWHQPIILFIALGCAWNISFNLVWNRKK